MTTKRFRLVRCRQRLCGCDFQPVGWLKWRVAGYCSKDCVPIPLLKQMFPNEKIKGKGEQGRGVPVDV